MSVKAGEKGVSAGADVAVDTNVQPMVICEFTELGIALSATAAGAMYWKDLELN